MKKLLFVILCLASLHISAQGVTDSTKTIQPVNNSLRPTSFILPVTLITYGSLSFGVHPIHRLDYYINDKLKPGIKTDAATYLVFTPVVAVYGLNLVGIQGKHNFADRTALLALTGVFAGAFDFSLKHSITRKDPGGSYSGSFPSGHTLGAFAAAEFLSQEYGDESPVYTIAGYTVAVATGVLRLETHDHWFSEVVAGAGFGILSTRLAYLVYPPIHNWLTHGDEKVTQENRHRKSRFRNTVFSPSFRDGSYGFAFSTDF